MKKQKFKHKCERCNYKWYSNKENIKYCTNCKNPILLTAKKVEDLQCCKCKHKWKQRGDKVPKECPSCKNPNWDKIDSKQMVKLIPETPRPQKLTPKEVQKIKKLKERQLKDGYLTMPTVYDELIGRVGRTTTKKISGFEVSRIA